MPNPKMLINVTDSRVYIAAGELRAESAVAWSFGGVMTSSRLG